MTSTAPTDQLDPDLDRQLKARHRAMWASGDYPLVARTVIPDLGAVLVEASGVREGTDACSTWPPAPGTPRFPPPRPGRGWWPPT